MNAYEKFNVIVYEIETDEVVEVVAENKTERQAERIQKGV